MKKYLPFALIAVALGLTACNPTASTSSVDGTSETETTSETTVEHKTAWTDEEKAIFEEELAGYVPPFAEALDGMAVEAPDIEDSPNYARISSDFKVDYSLVNSYGALLEEDGFMDMTDWAPIFGIELPEGLRLYMMSMEAGVALEAQVFLFDDAGQFLSSGEGYFGVDFYASIPYYEFPTEPLNAGLLEYWGVEGVTIPAFDAEYYDYLEPDAEYNTFEIAGPATSDLTASYVESLLAHNYVEEHAEGETLYVDPTGQIMLSLVYDAENKTFTVVVYQSLVFEWPAEDVAAAVKALSGSDTLIPALVGADYYVVYTQWLETSGEFSVYCYGGDYIESFETILLGAGYEKSEAGAFLSEDGYLSLTLSYDDKLVSTDLKVKLGDNAPTTYFPSEKIAELLAQAGLEGVVIPAPVGEFSAYTIDATFWPGSLYVYALTDDPNCGDAYIALLEEQGWYWSDDAYGYIHDSYAGISLAASYASWAGGLEIGIYQL